MTKFTRTLPRGPNVNESGAAYRRAGSGGPAYKPFTTKSTFGVLEMTL